MDDNDDIDMLNDFSGDSNDPWSFTSGIGTGSNNINDFFDDDMGDAEDVEDETFGVREFDEDTE